MDKKEISINTVGHKNNNRLLSKILKKIIKETSDSSSIDINERIDNISVNVKHLEYSLKSKKHK